MTPTLRSREAGATEVMGMGFGVSMVAADVAGEGFGVGTRDGGS